MVKSPKVFIIILNYNNTADTLECLSSVYRSGYPNFEVIVVDNGSGDDSVRSIRKSYSDVTLIENRENLGFTGGNNIAMQHGMSDGADYVLLLNSDTVIDEDTIDTLISYAENSPETGLISPVVSYYDDPAAVQFCGSYIDWDNMTIIYAKSPEETMNWRDDSRRDQCLFGTALLIRKEVIRDIGYLDEKFFAYWEDTDYSVRAAKAGYQNRVVSEARILHKTPIADRREIIKAPHYYYYMLRNEYLFWTKYIRPLKKIPFARKYLAFMIQESAQCRLHISHDCADACFDGAWNALSGHYGPWDSRSEMPSMLKKLFSWHPNFWFHLLQGNFASIFGNTLKKLREQI